MSLGEFDIIARYFAGHGSRRDVLLGIGDDAAVLEVPAGRRLVVAMDTVAAGVHYPAGTAAADIGYRSLAVNLSDLAAMGAVPSWMTLSLSLPAARADWLEGFAGGLFQLADRHAVALIGGDTIRGPEVVTVQIAGWVEADGWMTRSGARPGDLVYVSGVPGEAAAGLAVIQSPLPGPTSKSGQAAAEHLRQRFLRPEPRVPLGRALRGIASAAMDVSDGLLTDLGKLCAASGCGATLDTDALPESAAMRSLFDAAAVLDFALAGGDDYELLFTVPAERVSLLAALGSEVPCTCIGVVTEGQGAEGQGAEGQGAEGQRVICLCAGQVLPLRRQGHDHFGS